MKLSSCVLDCDAGRTMGCGTYCCQLLVRLSAEEAVKLNPDQPEQRFLEKDSDGLCVHLDKETMCCKIWNSRPAVCREFDCNDDDLLQVALTEGFTSIVQLSMQATKLYLPKEMKKKVPVK